MQKYKKILIKVALCLFMVFGLFLIGSDTAYAGNCFDCTCEPGASGRHPWSGEWNYSGACTTTGSCEVYCGGHRYDKGPGTTNGYDAGWDWTYDEPLDYYHDEGAWGCARWRFHRVRLHYKCSICGQIIGWDEDIREERYEHNLVSHDDPFIRDASDPCKVLNHHTEACAICGLVTEDRWDFMGWSHLNYGAGFNQTHPDMTNIVSVVDCDKEHRPDIYASSSQGDTLYTQGQGPVNEDAHAVWCQSHGYVNIENVEEGSRPELGNYIGDKTNYLTPLWLRTNLSEHPNMQYSSFSLHLYDHDMEVISENGSIVTEKCKYCEHVEEYDLNNVILSSRRTDNDHLLGWSDLKRSKIIDGSYQNSTVWFEHKIKDVDSGSTWYNHTGEWDLIIDGSLGPNRILSQDGTHTVASREHYDRYTEKIHNKGTDDEYSEWVLKQENVTKTTKSHKVRIDTTEPETNVNVQVGSYKNPITKLINSDGTYNSLGYGLKITLDSDDRNPKAKQGQNDVSKLFVAYLEMIPVDEDGR